MLKLPSPEPGEHHKRDGKKPGARNPADDRDRDGKNQGAPFASAERKHAAEIGVITKADDIVCAVHAYKAGATKNVAMRFYYAGAAL